MKLTVLVHQLTHNIIDRKPLVKFHKRHPLVVVEELP
jgi:hypothetical protein